ncbi:MAG TPA: non-ribosomal peptide synthetase [Candidatus Acidoferrum sp.]|nr:non-ribosomal peptide synthetase [Candidatus Acidoferrum sp.]
MERPSSATGLTPEQTALRAKCFHPTGTFIEFKPEEIDRSISDRFEDQVRKHSNRLAVKSGHDEFTYAELNQAANRIAHAILAERGDREEQVGLLQQHGAGAIMAALGALKAGKTYVPLDPTAPNARNRHILEHARVGLLVADDANFSLARDLARGELSVMNMDALEPGLSVENPGLKIPSDRHAYIMYTSGSTGEPKGVVQTHKNVLYKNMGWVNVIHISPSDRLSLLRSLSVSGSIKDLFGGLLSGAAVFPFNVKRDGLAPLDRWLADEEITIFNCVATLFRNFCATLSGTENFPSVRLLKLSGEPVYKRDVELYKKHFSRDCLAINMLSSAEVGTTRVYFMDKQTEIHDNLVPVGYPLEGCEVLILDADGTRLGSGQTGEIAVQSRYLSPGYWRMPDLTASCFLPDPEGGAARVYRTGDLGCMLPDGCLLHRGRTNSHVKVRGYSVEIAEVQAALSDLAEVKDVVVTTQDNAQGDQILVAYIVPHQIGLLSAAAVRSAIAAKLPAYMIPSAFVFLDSMPLAGPGKVNLKALPELARSRPELQTPLALPRTPIEEKIAQMWAEVLGLEQVGIDDDFFQLGGDSLIASRIVARIIATFEVEIPLGALFNAPKISTMASVLVAYGAAQAEGEVAERPRI